MSSNALILAGGRRALSGPASRALPDPLTPVAGRAALDIVIRGLRADGFTDVVLSVGHLSHLIRAVFGDGSLHGVSIRYHQQDQRGSATALLELRDVGEPFVVASGHVLTTLDYRRLVEDHTASGAALTVVTRAQADATVATGTYVIEPEALEHLPAEGPAEPADLMVALIDAGEPVGSYAHDGLCADVTSREELELARSEVELAGPGSGLVGV